MKTELRFSGTGGQGVITAAIILAEAALLDSKNAVQSQAYGPEARGGSSKAECIISDGAIYFSKVTAPDVLLAMSQEAADKFSKDLKDDCIVITDKLFVQNVPKVKGKVYELDITRAAKNELGKTLFSNIVALGAVVAVTKVVSEESLEKAVLNRVPAGTEEKNKKALAVGKALVG